MSDTEMKYEDWLRGCVHHDGRKGNVYLPCDAVLAIADWIEAHRYDEPVVRCKDCKYRKMEDSGLVYCASVIGGWTPNDWYCADGERKDDETD